MPLKRRGHSLPLGLVPASPDDYARFLAAYVKAGGTLSGYHDSFRQDASFFERWFVACRDFEIEPLYGADSINVIVPADVQAIGGDRDRGHNQLFEIANPLSGSHRTVPAFGDLPLADAASGYLLEQLEQAVEAAKAEHDQLMREIDAEDHRLEQQSNDAKEFFTERTLPDLRPASAEDYQRWLNGYKANGGEISTRYPYPVPTDRFYVALRDFQLPEQGLHGANYVSIIIPPNVRLLGGAVGHCDLFYEEGFTCADRGAPFVPAYSNAY